MKNMPVSELSKSGKSSDYSSAYISPRTSGNNDAEASVRAAEDEAVRATE